MRRLLLFILAISLLVSACGGDGIRRAAGSPTPRPRPLPPTARSSADVDPVFHVGQEIFITDDGFKPRTLVAIVEEKVRWINETDEITSVRFWPAGWESGPIEPGESAEYTPPDPIAITYELVGDPDTRGAIQVEVYFDPGEDPAAEDRRDADTPEPRRRSPSPRRR